MKENEDEKKTNIQKILEIIFCVKYKSSTTCGHWSYIWTHTEITAIKSKIKAKSLKHCLLLII